MTNQPPKPTTIDLPQNSSSSADRAALMARFRDLKSKLEAADKGDFSKLDLPIELETLSEGEKQWKIAERIAEVINDLIEVQYQLQSETAAGPKGRKPAKTPKKPSSTNQVKITSPATHLDDL